MVPRVACGRAVGSVHPWCETTLGLKFLRAGQVKELPGRQSRRRLSGAPRRARVGVGVGCRGEGKGAEAAVTGLDPTPKKKLKLRAAILAAVTKT